MAPLAVSVPPAETDHSRARVQAALAVSVAVRMEVPPDEMAGGPAARDSPVTEQGSAAVTVTVALPSLVPSSTLVAVMV